MWPCQYVLLDAARQNLRLTAQVSKAQQRREKKERAAAEKDAAVAAELAALGETDRAAEERGLDEQLAPLRLRLHDIRVRASRRSSCLRCCCLSDLPLFCSRASCVTLVALTVLHGGLFVCKSRIARLLGSSQQQQQQLETVAALPFSKDRRA